MAINPMFILGNPLQIYFVDKNNGLPLSNGQVFFYSDINRNVLKPVYQITGSPPNYSFIQLPNPVILSGVGTIQDANGNDVLYYFFPFDANGNVEQYFIVVEDQFGSIQFTREGLPPIPTNFNPTPAGLEVINYVPNGQFLLHNNFNNPNPPVFPYGGTVGNNSVQTVAPGGFTFEKPFPSLATNDSFSFARFPTFLDIPSGSPRYAIELKRGIVSTDAICDLRIKFNDVNKFQPITDFTETYTLFFYAQSLSGAPLTNVNIYVIDYFGVGGSTTVQNFIDGPFTFPSGMWQQFAINFTFPSTAGLNVGPNDDDFLQIAIRLPSSIQFDVQITDIMLAPDNLPLGLPFTPTTNGEFVLEALSNLAPTSNPESSAYYAEDGSNLYLPVIMTPKGFTYDYSQIGKIFSTVNSVPGIGELLCDGAQYFTNNYSSDGIPYSRLQKSLYNSTINMPIFGTGPDSGSINLQSDNSIMLTTNKLGVATATNIGTTTFTINTIHFGSTGYGVNGAVYTASSVIVEAVNNGGPVTDPSDGTGVPNQPTGWTINSVQNNAATKQVFTIVVTGVPPASSYFNFSSVGFTNYYMWFTVNGVGVDPAPAGRTGIQVNLFSTMSTNDIAIVVSQAISGRQQTRIVPNTAITPGQYWEFFTSTPTEYFVFYTVDGNRLLPILPGIGIEVKILSTDTAVQIAQKTMIAVNSFYFATPDLRGLFLRGWANGSNVDPSRALRFSSFTNGLLLGDNIGTMEYDVFAQHIHGAASATVPGTGQVFGTFQLGNHGTAGPEGYSQFGTTSFAVEPTITTTISPTGDVETRPVNMSVNYVIKY